MFRKGWAGLRRYLPGFLARPPLFVRSIYASTLYEDFFVSAVASLLAIRLYLHLTGYPQLAIGALHIAHVLWGGLLMLVALVILLGFLNHSAAVLAAVLGGIGFGAFIDEIGKFVTQSNDYFFQPAVALIYIVFVLLFFALLFIGRHRPLSPQEYLTNAFEIIEQSNLDGLDPEEKEYARELLQHCPCGIMRQSLETVLASMSVTPSPLAQPLVWLRLKTARLYEWLAAKWWFGTAVVGFFTLNAVVTLYGVVTAVAWSWGVAGLIAGGVTLLAVLVWLGRPQARRLSVPVAVAIIAVSILVNWVVLANLKSPSLSTVDLAQLIFPDVSVIFILLGVLVLPRDRLAAYHMFRRAAFISIFFTQVLSFYESQFWALLGLLGNILILVALRYMIINEEMRVNAPSAMSSASASTSAPDKSEWTA